MEPPSKLKTNCAKTVHETYDNIFISMGAVYEFGEEKAIIDVTLGLIPWDIWDPWKDMTGPQIRKIISDHRPVWVKSRIDLADDD